MDRSQRLTDGTRWRTFMRLLRLDDPNDILHSTRASELASSWWISTSARPQDSSRHGAAPRRCSALGITSSMALGTRYPYGRRSDSGAPMNER